MSATDGEERFAASRDCFAAVVCFLAGEESARLTHGELEDELTDRARELFRRLYQEHLDLRALSEQRLEAVLDNEGSAHRSIEADHRRCLETLFGEVTVTRLAYRKRGEANLHPQDGVLNLPEERHSHGLRRLCAVESARGSFEEAKQALERATGVVLGKRQVEELTCRAAVDFEAFYDTRKPPVATSTDVLVISADGKGVVMRPDALRPATQKAAAAASPKLGSRLSKGEKHNRKRIAEIASVYDVTPVPRSVADIFPESEEEAEQATPGPVAKHKWLTASVAEDASNVISHAFDEGERRDPDHQRPWVALVDGANHQIDCIKAEAKKRSVTVTIVVDIVHVLEYLWSAAWSFFHEGDLAAESWVADKARAVLEGRALAVAAGIRRRATREQLAGTKRTGADRCADYLVAKAPYLDYPTALAKGWQIATGVIEGACRHLAKDRLDLTGARWGIEGAEAILKLRALRANGDFEEYWKCHVAEERRRIHESRYAGGVIPAAA